MATEERTPGDDIPFGPEPRNGLEQAILADMIWGRPHPAQTELAASDFVGLGHAEIFRALVEMREAGLPGPGGMALREWLRDHGKDISDQQLAGLTDYALYDGNEKAKIVMLKRRVLRDQISREGDKLAGLQGSTEELLAGAHRLVERGRELSDRDDAESTEEIVDRLLAESAVGPDPRQMVTGWAELDQLGALTRSSLTIVGARTSVGKTAFCCSLVTTWLGWDRGVVWCSAEESPAQIVGRLAAMMPGRDPRPLKGVRLLVQQVRRIPQIEAALASAAFTPEVLVVDHLHDLRAERPNPSRVQEVGDLMRDLRDIAQHWNIPLLIAAQLNREAAKRDGGLRLEDLRDSGEIEQLADKVWLIQREKAATEAILLVAKNRSGPSHETLDLTYHPDQGRFSLRWAS